MLTRTTRVHATMRPTADPIQQCYVTHCLLDEGVQREAGFGIRASSTTDPLLLRFALAYPPYELPAGLDPADTPQAPRRLALVRLPGGGSVLLHSVQHVDRRRNRANNFFTHVIAAPGISPRQALAAWASMDWATECDTDTPKTLPTLTDLPTQGPVCDEAATAFLQPSLSAPDADLATLICPGRLAADAERRRTLLLRVVRACQLVCAAGAPAGRNRFFLAAEPGLAALLLYGAVRLLPPSLAEGLTFSTYEHLRRGLRSPLARVVATYPGPSDAGLPDECFTARGYALDTLGGRCSDELDGPDDSAALEWIDLAARGEWAVIDDVHRLIGKTDTLFSFREGLEAAKRLNRLSKGRAAAKDIIALGQSSVGSRALDQYRDRMWPIIRDASLKDGRWQDSFAHFLPEYLTELEEQLRQELQGQPLGDWMEPWQLLRTALQDDPRKLQGILPRCLPDPPYPPGLRAGLLKELRDLGVSCTDPRLPVQPLMRKCTVQELDELGGAGLPAEWVVWPVMYAILREETREAAVRHLLRGDEAFLRTFWEQFKLIKDGRQKRSILAPVLEGSQGREFLSRTLHADAKPPAEALSWVLDTLGALHPDWADFWRERDHLALLLDLLIRLGGDAGPLWERVCRLLGPELLTNPHSFQQAVLMALRAAQDRGALPGPIAQVIGDWAALRDHFEKASATSPDERQPVIDVCKRLNQNALDLLRGYFTQYVLPQGLDHAVLGDFAGFVHSFYREGGEYHDHANRFLGWLDVVRACPDERARARYQHFYLDTVVPAVLRERLAVESRQAGRLLEAPKKTSGPQPEDRAGAAVQAGPEPRPSADAHLLPHLGAYPDREPSPLRRLWLNTAWLLVTVAGGAVAAWMVGTFALPERELVLLCAFLPLVYSLAENASTHGLVTGLVRRPGERASFRALGAAGLAGLGLGLFGGILSAGCAFVLGSPAEGCLAVGFAAAAGVAAATLAGRAISWRRAPALFPSGPAVRALAGGVAVAVYLALGGVFIR